MSRTTVVNVRGRKPAELLDDPRFIYVGRAVHRLGWKRSFWGNPYRLKKGEDPSVVVAAYEGRLRAALAIDPECPSDPSNPQADLLDRAFATAVRSELPQLRGKQLGCWCCDWDGTGEPARPCHAVILARLADEEIDR